MNISLEKIKSVATKIAIAAFIATIVLIEFVETDQSLQKVHTYISLK